MMQLFPNTNAFNEEWLTLVSGNTSDWTTYKMPRVDVFYAAKYCECIHESSYAVISLHRTKTGAYRAMKAHRVAEYVRWYDFRMKYGKERGEKYFSGHEDWCISEYEVKP